MPPVASNPRVKLTAGEVIVGSLALVTVAITTWAFAGKASWAPATFTGLSILTALASIVVSIKESNPLRWAPFAPFVILLGLVTFNVLNLSHYPDPNVVGSWLPNENFIEWLPSTVDRNTTVNNVLPWASAFLLMAALRQTLFSARAIRLFWAAILIHGTIVALVGIYFHITSPYETLGLIRDRHGYHFSSFVYRNHWAATVILLVPIALGFSFSALRKWARDRGPFDATLGGFGLALLLTLTLPIPGSRSGLIVVSGILGVALVKLSLTILKKRSRWGKNRKWIPFAALIIFVGSTAAGGLFLTKAPLEQHWARTVQQIQGLRSGSSDLRLLLTRDTIRMTRDRPLWGWGVGSFAIVFPSYHGNYLRNEEGQIRARVMEAHNDWAQLSAETGVIVTLLFIWLISSRIHAGWRSDSVLERWVTGGLTLLFLYALVEFPLHNPAVLLTTFTLWSTIGRTKHKLNHSTEPATTPRPI